MPKHLMGERVAGIHDAANGLDPSPPTKGWFDSRSDAEVAADIAAYNTAYQGEMLRRQNEILEEQARSLRDIADNSARRDHYEEPPVTRDEPRVEVPNESRVEVPAVLGSGLINTNAYPEHVVGWKVVEHRGNGMVKWDPAKVELYLSNRQKRRDWIYGRKLRRELAGKPVLNATVLDYLVKNQLEIEIPPHWDNVCFWGTIYRDEYDGALMIRVLFRPVNNRILIPGRCDFLKGIGYRENGETIGYSSIPWRIADNFCYDWPAALHA